jgi:hypothetical protein
MSGRLKLSQFANPCEFVITLIRENLNNPDDLSKIMLAVESMMDAFEDEKFSPTLKQLQLEGVPLNG